MITKIPIKGTRILDTHPASTLSMRIKFKNTKLKALCEEGIGSEQYPIGVMKSLFRTMTRITAAVDERDLYVTRGSRFKKLTDDPQERRSIRLNQQYRLILSLEQDELGDYILIHDLDDHQGY